MVCSWSTVPLILEYGEHGNENSSWTFCHFPNLEAHEKGLETSFQLICQKDDNPRKKILTR